MNRRRVVPKHLALHQRLAHQPEFVVLKITKPAMDQLGGTGGRSAGKIVHLGQKDRIAPSGRITGDTAAVYAATDDKNVINRGVVHQMPPTVSQRSNLTPAATVRELFRTKYECQTKYDENLTVIHRACQSRSG
jgi:hypothetical protein